VPDRRVRGSPLRVWSLDGGPDVAALDALACGRRMPYASWIRRRGISVSPSIHHAWLETWVRPASRTSAVHGDAAYRPIPGLSGVVAAPAAIGHGTSVHSERVG